MTRAVLLALVVAAACDPLPDPGGAPCTSSTDCGAPAECVESAEGNAFLDLPNRAPTTCADRAPCLDALFPVEVDCRDGACACVEPSTACGSPLVWDPLTCACAERVRCLDDAHCAGGTCVVDGGHCGADG